MGAGTLNGIILLVTIGALFALVLLRQIPFQIIGRAVSSLFRPLGRLLGLNAAGKASSKSVNAANMGPSAWSALTRATRSQTETEKALGEDFTHENKHLKRQGLLFRWISVVVGYIRVPSELTREVAEDYYSLGSKFLNSRVSILANPQNLYEDEEGAVIARHFPIDAGAMHLLNTMRKTINSNVRKLTVVFSTIISTVLVINLLYNTGTLIDFHTMLGLSGPLSLGPVEMSAQDLNMALFGALSTISGAFIMWMIYFVEYVPYQRNNFRELSNFITRYLARLNDHFRTAEGQAKSVTVGQEKDASKFAHSARKWHTNVLWISLRIFHLEGYIRNIMFQMLRNSGYYLVFVPTLFLAVLAILNLILTGETGFNVWARIADLGVIFIILFVVLMAIYIGFLRNAMRSIDEINQDEWIGFDSLQVENVLGGIVGKYAEDVGYWKNRVGGSF